MASDKKRPTNNWVPAEEQPPEAEIEQRGVPDTRRLVKDTTKHPFNAVAFIEIKYFSDDRGYCGTGFLCENYLFITCAHNVRDNSLQPAKEVTITFGVNGEKDYSKKTKIILEGCDFMVPEKYNSKVDYCDIAWVNLKKYYQQNNTIQWDLADLPNMYFRTCSIPDEEGMLDVALSLSGKNVYVYIQQRSNYLHN